MSGLAKQVIKLIAVSPDARVGVALEDTETEVIASILTSAGAVNVDLADATDTAALDAAIVTLPWAVNALVPDSAKDVVVRVKTHGRVCAVITGVPVDVHDNAVAKAVGPTLDLHQVDVSDDRTDGAVLIRGVRRAKLQRVKLKRLRGLGHDLEPSVLVGRSGIDEDVVGATLEALLRHGLVKVKLTPQATIDKKVAANELAWATGAQLVQRVGKVAVLYRPDVKLEPPVARRRR
jgi:RNA-binding protein